MMERKELISGVPGFEYHFPDENVWVTVPTQHPTRNLKLIQKDIPGALANEVTPYVFAHIRSVVNFQVEEDDDESQLVTSFSPPMVLRVQYTEADMAEVQDGKRLTLGFWDGSQWVPFTKRKNLFHLASMFGIAVIRHWGDPTVAWGQ